MPLKGFTSLCSKYAMQIVSKDKGNPQYHRAKNPAGDYVTHYKIDGKVIKAGSRCDYLLLNEESRMAYLIELKGSDLVKAAEQLEANKCKTQEVRSSAYRKYQIRWKGRLMLRTRAIEEDIS